MSIFSDHFGKVPAQVYAQTPLMCHYTSHFGAAGIIGSQSIWATNVKFLNDVSELTHGIQIFKREFENRAAKETGGLKDCLNLIAERFGRWGNVYLYSCSFTENADQLSQWRGYNQGQGVALCFDFHHLASAGRQWEFGLARCVYDLDEKREIALKFIDEIVRDGPPNLDKMTEALRLAALFKDPSFHEESEWRMISTVVDIVSDRVKFHAARSLMVPHFEVGLLINDEQPGDIGLREVVVGPGAPFDLTLTSFHMMTQKNNLPTLSYKESIIPYRAL
ncbi:MULTISPECIES: DUF2971 domain-containing protein [Rhizobium]|uniref:DUF2971 domain-containing protein n=1 Tax=Rhizobium TaxID=379 RepID=UPI0007E59922|nr:MULTISPECIES: DUF2971 domain-containing protein [Rhizobium]TLX13112.1 DUF2971 domain-containing protein [Rhizobium sp. MHM7A]